MSRVKALIVPADGGQPWNASVDASWRKITGDLAGIGAELDGGYLEAISAPERTWHAYCDEEGKLKGLPVNSRATALAVALGWPRGGDVLCGPVVFLGNGRDGEEADVPAVVIRAALDLMKIAVEEEA